MTFTKNIFRGPFMYFSYGVIGGAAIFGILFGIIENEEIVLLLGAGLAVFVIFMFIIGFRTRVIINQIGVTQVSPFRRTFTLKWEDIRTAGVYKINRYVIRVLDPDKFDKPSYWGQKFIYLSTKEKYKPSTSQALTKDFIDLHWRPEAWTEISKYWKYTMTPEEDIARHLDGGEDY